MEKTRHFIVDLRTRMSHKDPRFQQLPIVPVVAFTHRADISAVHNFQEGIISLSELDDFFDDRIQRYNPLSYPSLQWIKDTVAKKIPNWDRILMRAKTTWIRGILVGHLTFTDIDEQNYQLPSYSTIGSIEWQKATESSYHGKEIYEMTVHYMNGSSRTVRCVSGKVYLAPTPGAQPQIYEVQDLQKLIVGLANKEI